jgi:hypothetical protein
VTGTLVVDSSDARMKQVVRRGIGVKEIDTAQNPRNVIAMSTGHCQDPAQLPAQEEEVTGVS